LFSLYFSFGRERKVPKESELFISIKVEKRVMLIFFQIFTVGIYFLLALPADAHAMHIGEGILPLGWSALWYLAAMPFVAFGLYKLKNDKEVGRLKPLLGMMAAAVFVISCMPVPVPTAGTCSHPAGTAMAAILIGPVYSILATAVALLLQALFLAHGGISTWGANIFSMGVVGSFSGYIVFKALKKFKVPMLIAAFAAGVIGDWATYAATSFELASALHGAGEFYKLFYTITLAFVPTQLPLGVLEGFLTAGAVKFLQARRPELLGIKPSTDRDGYPGGGPVKRLVPFFFICALFIFCLTPPAFAAEKWQGVDETVVEKYANEHGHPPKASLIELKGDALLFAFLVAGAVGGFVMGYYFRDFMARKRSGGDADAG
jgi:cobalt/nickel transport system permease protein